MILSEEPSFEYTEIMLKISKGKWYSLYMDGNDYNL